jgi:ribose transport system permease protein
VTGEDRHVPDATGDVRQAEDAVPGAPRPKPGTGAPQAQSPSTNGPQAQDPSPSAPQPHGPSAAVARVAEANRGTSWFSWRSLGRRLITASETWTLLALIIMMIFFTVRAPGTFLTLTNFSLIGQNSAPLLVMAVGQTFVILTAGIDLSVGSVLVLTGVVTDLYCIHHGGTNASWAAIGVGTAAGLATGAGWGAVQGFLIAMGKIPPLIVTLAGFGAASGAAYLITGGADFRTVPSRLATTIGQDSVAGVPWLIVISFAVAIVYGLVLAYTRFGRYTYAIGSNPEAARRAGIRVGQHLIQVYALSGLLSGVAGVLSLASFSSTTIAGHGTDNLTVITAVVLGGASLFGGRGSMLGTVIGLAIPAVLLNGLVIIGINEYWQDVAIGLVLVAAVYLDQFRRRLRERA